MEASIILLALAASFGIGVGCFFLGHSEGKSEIRDKAKELIRLKEKEFNKLLKECGSRSDRCEKKLDTAITRLDVAKQEIKTLKADVKTKAKELQNIPVLITELEDWKTKHHRLVDDYHYLDTSTETIEAYRNEIYGYEDEYLLPNTAAWDGLQDGLEHTRAAHRVEQLKEDLRALIKANGVCERPAASQHLGKIDTSHRKLLVNAFKREVDHIIRRAPKENFGVLKQKLKDLWTTTNSVGNKALGLKLSHQYHLKYQQLLKNVVVLADIKREEQEEQRAIKAQIREEEKAQREYQKRIKEDERKERESRELESQIHQRLTETDQSNQVEVDRLKASLATVQQELLDAISDKERTLSMAQQTKTGNVYVISNEGSFGKNIFKVGMTRRLDPALRVKELGDASVPFEFDVHAMIPSNNAPELERELHRKFHDQRVNKVNSRKEFFRCN